MSGSISGFITGGMTSNHCFVAGTLVATAEGNKAIENIQEGDLVISQDPESGDVTYKHVLETYVNETTELIHLNIDGEEIVTTPAHPFYVKDLGFVLAGDLEVGSTLIDSKGNELHIQIKRWEQLQECVPVYNFAVEDYHTYFVGTKNVLVHNNCGYKMDANGRYHRPNGQFASNAEMGIENPVKAVSTHGNSLSYPGTNYGYVLKNRNTGEVLKYGESINPVSRYTKAFLEDNNCVMEIIKDGTKRDIHNWQRDMNFIYKQFNTVIYPRGRFPKLSVHGY